MVLDSKGLFVSEYIMIAGFMFLIVCSVAFFIGEANEMNQAMAAARTGALEGAMTDSLAVYPDESFKDYESQHPELLIPSSVKIVKIECKNQGFNQRIIEPKCSLKFMHRLHRLILTIEVV